jgi:hypothetical protein
MESEIFNLFVDNTFRNTTRATSTISDLAARVGEKRYDVVVLWFKPGGEDCQKMISGRCK